MEEYKEDLNNINAPREDYNEEEDQQSANEEYNRINEINNDSNREENEYDENQDFMRKFIFFLLNFQC